MIWWNIGKDAGHYWPDNFCKEKNETGSFCYLHNAKPKSHYADKTDCESNSGISNLQDSFVSYFCENAEVDGGRGKADICLGMDLPIRRRMFFIKEWIGQSHI